MPASTSPGGIDGSLAASTSPGWARRQIRCLRGLGRRPGCAEMSRRRRLPWTGAYRAHWITESSGRRASYSCRTYCPQILREITGTVTRTTETKPELLVGCFECSILVQKRVSQLGRDASAVRYSRCIANVAKVKRTGRCNLHDVGNAAATDGRTFTTLAGRYRRALPTSRRR